MYVSAPNPERRQPEESSDLLSAVRRSFEQATAAGQILFTTDVTDLHAAFLKRLPEHMRQEYTCNACRKFVDTYGGLVTLDETGAQHPVMWQAHDVGIFGDPVADLARIVTRAKVTGVFLSTEKVWGLPKTGQWLHMAVTPAKAYVHKESVTKTAFQAMAEKKEEYAMLRRGLAEYPLDAVQQAYTLLSNGQLYRSEKCLGAAEWLLRLQTALRDCGGNKFAQQRARDNLVWQAVAAAPAGFAHVKSGMIGVLLQDIIDGLPFTEIKRRFDEKMDPTKYLRPQAAPKQGNLDRAEKVVAALQSAGALERRFARFSDLQEMLWTPPPPAPAKAEAPAGVFGHIKAKGAVEAQPTKPLSTADVEMTWAKFQRKVLPDAVKIEFYVPYGEGPYYAFTAGTNPEAPPILQWDREDRRNTVAWYTKKHNRAARDWNLRASQWCALTGITAFPFMWHGGRADHLGPGVLLVLDGCRDLDVQSNLALFPECLRNEYHEIRASIEAYAKTGRLTGADEADACGVGLRSGEQKWTSVRLRVTTTAGMRTTYKLDRWD